MKCHYTPTQMRTTSTCPHIHSTNTLVCYTTSNSSFVATVVVVVAVATAQFISNPIDLNWLFVFCRRRRRRTHTKNTFSRWYIHRNDFSCTEYRNLGKRKCERCEGENNKSHYRYLKNNRGGHHLSISWMCLFIYFLSSKSFLGGNLVRWSSLSVVRASKTHSETPTILLQRK